MNSKLPGFFAAIAVCIGVFVSAPASAQPATGAYWGGNDVSQHHQIQYQVMKGMTAEMSRMTEQMSQGLLTPEQSKEMAKRMAFMSTMMRRMSGLEARPAHTHAQLQNQMDQMRKLMDEMMGNSRMAPGAR
jgi:hypothetical protein